MKKTGSRRGSEYGSGLLSGVLTAPGESYASGAVCLEPGLLNPELRDRNIATRQSEQRTLRSSRGGPAPAGAHQRGFGGESYDASGVEDSVSAYGSGDEEVYVPQRGRLKVRLRGLPRSTGGRIVIASVVFVLLAGVAAAVAAAHAYLMHDSRFVLASSDDIQIMGAEHLSRDQILGVFAPDLERSIFRMPLAERQAALEQLPWVAHATVMRLLPDVVRVKIAERVPVAFVRQGNQVGLADSSGVLLDMPREAAGDPRYSFPVLTGVTSQETAQERAAQILVYLEFMRALDSTGHHLTESVSEVDISDPEDLRALITSGGSDVLVHFGQEHFLKRYEEFEQHLPEWKQAYPRLASADMRYEGQIVLGMQGAEEVGMGGTAQQAAAGAGPAATGPRALPRTAGVKPPAASSRRHPAAKGRVTRSGAGSGIDAANERVFAQLSQTHRAALSRQHQAAMAKADRKKRPGSAGRAAGTAVRRAAGGASGSGSYGVTP